MFKNHKLEHFVNPASQFDAAKESGGRSLLDPHGAMDPSMRKVTDPLNIIWRADDTAAYFGKDAGKTKEDLKEEAEKRKNAKVRSSFAQKMRDGGEVKKAPSKKQAKPRGSGCAQRGIRKCKMV